jgi:transposase
MSMMKDEQKLRAAIEALSESAKVDLIIQLMAQVAQLTARVAELEARLGMNSANSSKPPSSDGYSKPNPKSLREKSGRKPGGQKGHVGTNLRQVSEPDAVEVHSPESCVCGCCLDGVAPDHVERRQVFELPEKLLRVTEHRIVSKQCPQCGRVIRAGAPPETSGPVQYGPRFRALLVYLRDYQLLPYKRLTELCRDLLGAGVCKRTVETAEMQIYDALAPFEEAVRAQLLDEAVLHADETGMRVDGKLQWVHSLSARALTLYQAHPKRGGEAIEANGIIPAFKGVLVHDCWGPYFPYGGEYALCGAHLLRELLGVCENEGHGWAHELFVLLEMVSKTTAARDATPLSPELVDWFERMYDDTLARGKRELAPPEKTPGKRGRAKKSKSANLHGRLETHRNAVLRCLRDPVVPFTNNLAERDIRMVKLRQKTSGCARTFTGAETFARIRSYISTSLKQGKNLFKNIVDAVAANPWIPQPRTSMH